MSPVESAPLIRALNRSDRHAVAFSFARLGARSRHQRFLGAIGALTDAELDRMTGLDHWHHEALIACSPAPRAPIGVAEYVRLAEFDEAEIAVAVVDGWQRQGVGAELVRALRARALNAGIRHFTATALRGNRGALAVAHGLGRCSIVGAYRDTVELRIELSTRLPSQAPTARPTPARSLVRL
jgi:RimJ/RimL family protein N-acetyltransferase